MAARVVELRLRRLERARGLSQELERTIAALSDEELEAALQQCEADLVRQFGSFDAAVEATR